MMNCLSYLFLLLYYDDDYDMIQNTKFWLIRLYCHFCGEVTSSLLHNTWMFVMQVF